MTHTPDNAAERHHFPGPGTLDRAVKLVRFLRENCPWDAEQTAESLIPHLLEETHEVVDAIRDGRPQDVEGELGDLLLNLAFQIVVAEESGTMDSHSVYARLEEKMIRRHPHVFGDGERQDWEVLKAAERKAGENVLSRVAKGLDTLTKSYRIQERVAAVGFDWESYEGAWQKVAEELEEVRGAVESGDAEAVQEEIGDLLFAAVNLARLAGPHPTTALSRANTKFQARFERLEPLAPARGNRLESAGLEVPDGLWDEVKREEPGR